MSRTRSLLLLALGLAPLPGCAGLLRSYDVAPSGLTRSEEEFRLALVGGQLDSAGVQRTLTGDRAPGDELLRALYGGVTAFYAGRYQESGALLDVASALADDRVTKSISRSALALVTNDRALPYEPARTERLLIPYYAALAYLRLEDVGGALVETRRLAGLLEQYAEDIAPEERELHAALRYFAGAVFEAGGERNDAAVSYRHVQALALDTLAPVLPADSGDVVLVLEQGFVAHRVEESLTVLLAPGEIYGLRDGDPDHRYGFGRLLADRVMESAVVGGELRSGPLHVPVPATPLVAYRERERCEGGDRAAPGIGTVLRPDSSGKPVRAVANRKVSERCDDEDDAPYLLRVAWPNYRWTSRTPGAAPVATAGRDTAASVTFADVSTAVVHDFRSELPLILARTLVRGAAKAAITKGAEKKLEEKHEGLGKLVGVLGNVGNALLERADTRSWHLLPGSIGIARLRLAPGEHTLSVPLPGGPVVLERVRVVAGQTRVVHARAF